jgi:hypothetical protein
MLNVLISGKIAAKNDKKIEIRTTIVVKSADEKRLLICEIFKQS